jgi:subtilisin family serine protease
VSAAGNAGCCDTVLYPAKLPGSMAVAAVDANDQRAWFSSTGPEVDVAAPGVDILSTVPTGTCKLCDPSGYRSLSGTSMATPHVAGTGALLMSRGFTAAQAWTQMTGTAVDLGFPGFDLFYGWGRVDAYRAVTQPAVFLPIGDTTPPTVVFASPFDGYVIGQKIVTVSVEATDDNALSAIELRFIQTVNAWQISTLVATSASSPLTYKLHTDNLPSGTYTLDARAIDAAGNATSTSIDVIKP